MTEAPAGGGYWPISEKKATLTVSGAVCGAEASTRTTSVPCSRLSSLTLSLPDVCSVQSEGSDPYQDVVGSHLRLVSLANTQLLGSATLLAVQDGSHLAGHAELSGSDGDLWGAEC